MAILAVLGFLIALLTIFPRISVSNDAPLDADDAFATPFVVSNDGYLPLYSVLFLVSTRDVRFTDGRAIIGTPDYKSRWTAPDWELPSLYPTKRHDVYAGRVIVSHGTLQSADIGIIVQYRPAFWPFRREILCRFKTQQGYDGRLHWLHND